MNLKKIVQGNKNEGKGGTLTQEHMTYGETNNVESKENVIKKHINLQTVEDKDKERNWTQKWRKIRKGKIK